MYEEAEYKHSEYLHPGQVIVAQEATKVTTVLGSCVALTLFDERLKIGGICHALLPTRSAAYSLGEKKDNNFNFVDASFLYMLQEFDRLGSERDNLQVKLFGGSGIMNGSLKQPNAGFMYVGRKNVETAYEVCKRAGMKICAEDVGGSFSRKLHFYSSTGEVYLKYVSVNNNNADNSVVK